MSLFRKIKSWWTDFRKKGKSALGEMSSVSDKVHLYCPKCDNQLYGLTGRGAGTQLYFCRRCKYQGSIGLPKQVKSKVSYPPLKKR